MDSVLSQAFPPKSQFSVNAIPDLKGQVMIVTGGNTGIGSETVKALLAHNAKVYLAARSPSKAKQAIVDLKRETGKEAEFLQLDLADLLSVKKAAEEFMRKESQLHVLFNNGGVMSPPIEQVTVQGYDLQFGTNVLGHFFFTQLLLPTLITTATQTGKPARVINTSSSTAYLWSRSHSNIDYSTLKDGPARKKVDSTSLYWQSKFGNVIFSNELDRRYAEKGIMSVALNPGNLSTDLTRHMSPVVAKILGIVMLYPPPQGALTQLWAGTTEEGTRLGGKFLIPWARIGNAPSAALNPVVGRELWAWCEEQVAEVRDFLYV